MPLSVGLDLVEELRLRRWARENYAPVEERSVDLHPVILEEMDRRDAEVAGRDDQPVRWLRFEAGVLSRGPGPSGRGPAGSAEPNRPGWSRPSGRQRGMFPCFFGGTDWRLFSSRANAPAIRDRVSDGRITSST